MATLRLVEFRCVVDTDEHGMESPYFVTWAGNIETGESVVRYSRKDFWENKVEPSAWWPVGDVVTNQFVLDDTTTLALAIMVEEDEGTDLTRSEAEDLINRRMTETLNVFRRNGTAANDAQFIEVMGNALRAEVFARMQPPAGAEDDILEKTGYRAARQIVFRNKTSPVSVIFKGGNGKYEARYSF